MSLLKQKPNLLPERAGWPPVQGWWSPDYRGRNNTREMTDPSWVLVPTLKPIFRLLSMENVPTLHTNKLFAWLFKGSINNLACPRDIALLPPWSQRQLRCPSGRWPWSAGSREHRKVKRLHLEDYTGPGHGHLRSQEGTCLGPGSRALDKGDQKSLPPRQRPGLPATPHKAFLLQSQNKNNRCCRDWRLTSAECIFSLRERYSTKRRNYVAKRQIRTPNLGLK